MTKNNLGGEGFVSACAFRLPSMVERSQGRNLTQKPGRDAAACFTQARVSYFKPTDQGEDATHGGLGTPALIIKTIPHRHGHKLARQKHYSTETLFQVVQGCVQPTADAG